MKKQMTALFSFVILLIFCISFILAKEAATLDNPLETPPARLLIVNGDVKVFPNGAVLNEQSGKKEVKGVEGMAINEGDRIITKEDSLAVLVLKDKSTVKLHAHTDLLFVNIKMQNPNKENATPNVKDIPTRFKLFWGRIWASVEKVMEATPTFEVETPNSSAGVHGTSFEVIALPAVADASEGTNNTNQESNYNDAANHKGRVIIQADSSIDSKSPNVKGEKIETRVNVWDGVVKVKMGDQANLLSKYENVRVAEKGITPLPKLSEEKVSAWQSWNRQMDRQLNTYFKKLPPGEPLPKQLPQQLRKELPGIPKMVTPPGANLRNPAGAPNSGTKGGNAAPQGGGHKGIAPQSGGPKGGPPQGGKGAAQGGGQEQGSRPKGIAPQGAGPKGGAPQGGRRPR